MKLDKREIRLRERIKELEDENRRIVDRTTAIQQELNQIRARFISNTGALEELRKLIGGVKEEDE